jgi:hypothetical protein
LVKGYDVRPTKAFKRSAVSGPTKLLGKHRNSILSGFSGDRTRGGQIPAPLAIAPIISSTLQSLETL